LINVHFERDVKSFIDSVLSENGNSSWMGNMVEDIKVELQAFHQWPISFVKREGNNVAHLLAKHVVAHVETISWH
jgi:hypothetical protein